MPLWLKALFYVFLGISLILFCLFYGWDEITKLVLFIGYVLILGGITYWVVEKGFFYEYFVKPVEDNPKNDYLKTRRYLFYGILIAFIFSLVTLGIAETTSTTSWFSLLGKYARYIVYYIVFMGCFYVFCHTKDFFKNTLLVAEFICN